MAGGVAPFGLLEQSGVSFDPALRPNAPPPPTEQGSGLLPALIGGLALTAVTLLFALYGILFAIYRPGLEDPEAAWGVVMARFCRWACWVC